MECGENCWTRKKSWLEKPTLYNINYRDSDGGEVYSLNWEAVDTWNDPDVMEAKLKELESWENFDVYDEVPNEGQKYTTVQ